MTVAPAVLVMPAGESADPELGELLGAERLAALERLLWRRGLEWAEQVSGGMARVQIAAQGESLTGAVKRVLADAGGAPLLVIWPVLPQWRPEHAEAVLDDLGAGCEASVGPVFDGGLYMLALAHALPALLALPAERWEGPGAMGAVLGTLNEAGVGVGLLRAERALRRVADVRAAVADPLLDAELRAVLAG